MGPAKTSTNSMLVRRGGFPVSQLTAPMGKLKKRLKVSLQRSGGVEFPLVAGSDDAHQLAF